MSFRGVSNVGSSRPSLFDGCARRRRAERRARLARASEHRTHVPQEKLENDLFRDQGAATFWSSSDRSISDPGPQITALPQINARHNDDNDSCRDDDVRSPACRACINLSPKPRCHPGFQSKGKDEGGHARGKSRCDQFSAVISWNISMPCWGGWVSRHMGDHSTCFSNGVFSNSLMANLTPSPTLANSLG